MNSKADSFSQDDVNELWALADELTRIDRRLREKANAIVHFKATSKLSIAADRLHASHDRLTEGITALEDDMGQYARKGQ